MASISPEAGTVKVQDEAVSWFVRLRSDSVSQQDYDAFDRWTEESTGNHAVYQEYVDSWNSLDDCAASDMIMDMRSDALAHPPTETNDNSWWKYASIAASVALVFTAVFTFWSPQTNTPSAPSTQIAAAPANPAATEIAPEPEPQETAAPTQNVYRTAMGQRSTVNLPDGSVLELNTDSLVQVNYTPQRRDLILLRGEALFKVAKDKTRPFTVEADGKRVTALGTIFSVRRASGNVQVTLVEGSVTVDHIGQSGTALASVKMIPGQQLTARSRMPFKVKPVNIRAATSWRDGRLVFDNEPLAQIVAEMNRYSSQQIIIGDKELSDLRVSGTFSVGSVDSFAAALEASFPVKSRQGDNTNQLILEVSE